MRDAATVDVCFTPREIRPVDVAVVVDVLRATSTIVQALAVGYPRVVCCGSVATARKLRASGSAVLAGESACVRVPDFELGNSPAAVATAGRRGEELVLATTNGTPAIVGAARAAERVLVGCLLNLRALLAAVPPDAAVAIVCAGTNGRPALEDVYVAGRLVAALGGVPSDAARVAECVASGYRTAIEALSANENAARLRATGQERDIAWCARESVLDIVPEVSAIEDGASVVTPAGAASHREEPIYTSGKFA